MYILPNLFAGASLARDRGANCPYPIYLHMVQLMCDMYMAYFAWLVNSLFREGTIHHTLYSCQ